MAGPYSVQWANGTSFHVLKLNSEIMIDAKVPYPIDQNIKVTFANTNLENDPSINAVSHDGYTIEADLAGTTEKTRAVMVEWLYTDADSGSKKWVLFGEVFVGDPDGAGGFGGEQNAPGGTPPTKRR